MTLKLGTAVLLPPVGCINCGKELSGATCVGDDGAPNSGDITVCLYCGHMMAYASDLSLRELTSDEMHEIAGDERILAIQRARQRAEQSGSSS